MSLLNSPNALTAWGVLDENDTPERVAKNVVNGTARVWITEDPDTAKVGDASALEAAWRAVAAEHKPGSHHVGIRAIVDIGADLDRDAILGSMRGADGLGSLYVVDQRLEDHGDFHWPLRLGYGAGEAVRQAVLDTTDADVVRPASLAAPAEQRVGRDGPPLGELVRRQHAVGCGLRLHRVSVIARGVAWCPGAQGRR